MSHSKSHRNKALVMVAKEAIMAVFKSSTKSTLQKGGLFSIKQPIVPRFCVPDMCPKFEGRQHIIVVGLREQR